MPATGGRAYNSIMKTYFETELRAKLTDMGAAKLPASVYGALVSDITADLQVALKKSLQRRTSPRALARVFAECLTGQWARDSKGNAVPFGKLQSVSPKDETLLLICTDKADKLSS